RRSRSWPSAAASSSSPPAASSSPRLPASTRARRGWTCSRRWCGASWPDGSSAAAVTEYLLLFAIVLGVNLLPAFGPPTWSIIVLFGLNSDLPAPAIVIVGALAAALGRFSLAHGFRLLRRWVSDK